MIGKKIKEYRQALKLTGATLANLAGINQPYLSQIENEKKVPPFDTFMNLVDAIAKNAPLTDENAPKVLTEENYQEFKLQLVVDTGRPYGDKTASSRIYAWSRGDLESFDELFLGYSDNKADEVTEEEKEAGLRNYFFKESLNEVKENAKYINLPKNDYGEAIIYEFKEVRQSLYEWWYNHILTTFHDATLDEVIENDNISEGETNIFLSLASLMNEDGTFTPNDNGGSSNLSKELLDGKIVTFDLNEATNKNVRLLIDGQLLSAKEMDMLKVSLGAIKYYRQKR